LESGGRFSFGALMLDQWWWYTDTSGVSLLCVDVVFYFSSWFVSGRYNCMDIL
jgi:hypothetical protein